MQRSRLGWYGRELASLGLVDMIRFKRERRGGARAAEGDVAAGIGDVGSVFELRSRHAAHPLALRRGTSDLQVFHSIFVAREYRCLDDMADAGLVIDCGANVGYSAVDFLNRFPNAHVIAVEPDAGNFALLERNLAPYGSRSTAIHAAVWPHATELFVRTVTPGLQHEWGVTVREAMPGESPLVPALDIGSLLEASAYTRMSLLKIDIEGSELEVFSANVEPWIDRFDRLVIELHDAACVAAVKRALRDQPLATSRCDELTVFTRLAA